MDCLKARIWMAGCALTLVALAGCGSSPATPIAVFVESTPGWQVYTNQKYNFSLDLPPGWKATELLAADDSMDQDEIWFTAGEFPPAHTDTRPDVLLIVSEQEPSTQWARDYFNDYQSEVVPLGQGSATRITGIKRESLNEETVFIMGLNGVYLQAFPGKSKDATEYFNLILASLKPVPEFVSIPAPSVSSEPSATKDPCIFPYFDPVAFLPHHDRILVRADTGVKVFNLKTLEEELTLEPVRRQVVKAALSNDGHLLAWALDDHTIELIDLDSGEVLTKLEGHSGLITAIKFSANGDRLYTASHDHSVRVWNDDGSLVSEIIPGGGEVLGIGISPDDRRLAIVTFEGPQKLWDLRTRRTIRRIRLPGAFDGADAAFSPDGNIFGMSLGGGPVSLWDSKTGRQLWSGGEYTLALSPDGHFFAYSDAENDGSRVIVIRSLDRLPPVHVLNAGGPLIWKIIVSPDGSRLASANGNEIRIWQVEDGTLIHTLKNACP